VTREEFKTEALCHAAVSWARAVERYQYLECRYHLQGIGGDVELPDDVVAAGIECRKCEKALLKAVEVWEEGEDA
jgi:hypothetical protein